MGDKENVKDDTRNGMEKEFFMTKKRTRQWTLVSLAATAMISGAASVGIAGDGLSGTYLDPALQRQDFLPHTLWNVWPEHRAVYNRPRFVGGLIASKIEPSSQEAMSWRTNYCNGNYANHAGRYVPLYYYPKPWEVINTQARPDNKPKPE